MAKRILGWAIQFAFFGLAFTAGRLLFDYTAGNALKPVSEYWAYGFISGGMFWFITLATREGWLRGVIRDPGPDALEQRRKKLAEERQRAIDEALARRTG